MSEINHFPYTEHFKGVTKEGRKFVFCPVGQICSWSPGDYDNDWCHFEYKYFSEVEK